MTEPQASGSAIFYGRVSRTNGRTSDELERHTLNEQRSLAHGMLPRSLELLDEELIDVNVSGKHSERPALRRLFELAERGAIDAVVVGYLSRFGRNAQEALENLTHLHRFGVTVYFAKEQLIAAPGMRGTAKLLVTILAAIAEMELDKLSDGLQLANATALASGVSIAVPYGYTRANGPGSPLVPDDDDEHGLAPDDVVRLIFKLRCDGMGASDIADELNAREVPTPSMLDVLRGKREHAGAALWAHNTVRGIVAVRTYTGVIPRAIAWRTSKSKRNPNRRIPCAWEYLPGEHEPLIDEDTFKAAQLSGKRAVRNGRIGGALLQGLVRCEHCSRSMTPSRTGKLLTYKCRGGAACERPSSIARAPVDAFVLSEVVGFASRLRTTKSSNVLREQLRTLESELDVAEASLSEYVGVRERMRIEHFLDGYRQQSEAIDELKLACDTLRAQLSTSESDELDDIAERPLAEQRAGLLAALDAVVIRRAPGRGRAGVVDERVVLVAKGHAPFALSGTGRVVEPRSWPL